jgi:hypothetical protein
MRLTSERHLSTAEAGDAAARNAPKKEAGEVPARVGALEGRENSG